MPVNDRAKFLKPFLLIESEKGRYGGGGVKSDLYDQDLKWRGREDTRGSCILFKC